ncbi:MAG: hypothetical protein AAGF48_10415 [Pseudomonadota bacterium]
MRRPHRTIETFDISLMAVVTKAMGAFLVLMLLLLPYYTPDSTEEDATELLRQLQLLDAKLDEVQEQLGDPNKTVEELRQELDDITATSTLRAEVLAKLRGLINKAFSEIRRLEAEVATLEEDNAALTAKVKELEAVIDPLKAEIARLEEENARLLAEIEPLRAENEQLREENAALAAENAKLEEEILALLARIAALEEELRRLQTNQPRKQYKGVMVSYDVRNCNDVQIKGTILKSGKEEGYTFNSDGAKMAPEYLLQANFAMDGGTVPRQESTALMDGAVGARSALSNAGMLTDQTIGKGEYLIVLVKRDPRRRYAVNDKSWVFLSGSGRDCSASIAAAARAAFVDDWASSTSISWTFPAKKIAGISLALTSDDDGIKFRAPTDEEEAWLDKLLKLALETQDNIPEIKKAREEAERKAREAEEKRRLEAEERRKREEEEKKSEPTTSHMTPAQLNNARSLMQRLASAPRQSAIRRNIAGLVPRLRAQLDPQIAETEKQLETLKAGKKRERTEAFLKELRSVSADLDKIVEGGQEPGGAQGKKEGKQRDERDSRSGPRGGGLKTNHVSPRDLRQLDSMFRAFKQAPKDSKLRERLGDQLKTARARIELQIEETEEQIRSMPAGPARVRAERFLGELQKYRSEE